jgi:hypothetical protein
MLTEMYISVKQKVNQKYENKNGQAKDADRHGKGGFVCRQDCGERSGENSTGDNKIRLEKAGLGEKCTNSCGF